MKTVPQPAIPARKSRLGSALIYWLLVRPAFWNSFDRVRLQLVGRLPRREDGPLIFYLNHPGWWDAYMCMLLEQRVLRGRFRFYGMVEEPQLRAYRFFTLSGGFSVDRHNRYEAARSVAYSCHLLQGQPRRALCIFPQGTITPNDQRPLVVYPGLAHIVKRLGGARLCPVALRYEFRGEQRPEAFMRIGPLHYAAAPVNVRALTEDTRQRLSVSAAALRDAVAADAMDQFCVLLRGKPGINRLFDRLKRPLSGSRP